MRRKRRNPFRRIDGHLALALLIQLQRGDVYAVDNAKAALGDHVKHYLHRAKRVR